MHCLHTRLNVCARTGFPTGARENPPPQITCGRRSRLSSKVHTSRHEKRRYRAYVEVLWVGLPARYLRGGNVRGRGLQKSRWRVRFGCIVATHLPRDKIAGWVTLGAGVPPALSRPHTARDRGCGRCNSEDRRQQVGIFSKFRQVSEITKDRLHIVDFPADLLAGIVLIGCRRDPRLYARCEGAVSSPPGPCLVPLRSPIRAGLGTRSGSSRG